MQQIKHAPNMALRTQEAKDMAGSSFLREVSFEWDSFEIFEQDVDWIRKHNPVQPTATGFEHGYRRAPLSWFGGPDTEGDYRAYVRNGWPALRARLDDMMREVELDIPSVPSRAEVRRRKRHRDDHGDTLDMHRVWNGDLARAWERPVRADVHTVTTKRVTIAVDVMSGANIENDQALWRAALAVALCSALARAGKVFEVWVTASYSYLWRQRGTPARCWHGWCVKRTADPLNLDRMASMTSVGMLRSASFWAAHAVPGWDPTMSYGQCANSGLPHTLQARKDAGEVVLRIDKCYSKAQMLAEYARAWKEVEKHAEQLVA